MTSGVIVKSWEKLQLESRPKTSTFTFTLDEWNRLCIIHWRRYFEASSSRSEAVISGKFFVEWKSLSVMTCTVQPAPRHDVYQYNNVSDLVQHRQKTMCSLCCAHIAFRKKRYSLLFALCCSTVFCLFIPITPTPSSVWHSTHSTQYTQYTVHTVHTVHSTHSTFIELPILMLRERISPVISFMFIAMFTAMFIVCLCVYFIVLLTTELSGVCGRRQRDSLTVSHTVTYWVT